MDTETIGYVLGAIIATAVSAWKLQRTMKTAPVWDNGEKLGMRDAVMKLIEERNNLSKRLIILEGKSERMDRLESAMDRQTDRIDTLEQRFRAWRST